MNFLPALCPVSFTLRANRAVWIFGEMCPQVVLSALPLNKLVDLLHVGAARDATELFVLLLLFALVSLANIRL